MEDFVVGELFLFFLAEEDERLLGMLWIEAVVEKEAILTISISKLAKKKICSAKNNLLRLRLVQNNSSAPRTEQQRKLPLTIYNGFRKEAQEGPGRS